MPAPRSSTKLTGRHWAAVFVVAIIVTGCNAVTHAGHDTSTAASAPAPATSSPTPFQLTDLTGGTLEDANQVLEVSNEVDYTGLGGMPIENAPHDPENWRVCAQTPAPGILQPGQIITLAIAHTTDGQICHGTEVAPAITLPDPTGLPGDGTDGAQDPTTPANTMPAHNGATALCNDGTLSYSQHHRGTCSHHHGVAQWFN